MILGRRMPNFTSLRGDRWKLDCRISVVCGRAVLAGAPFDADRAYFAHYLPYDAPPATAPNARSEGGTGRPGGGQPPGSPRLPGPDHQPQGPSVPGIQMTFSSSADFQSGAVLGLIAVLLGLTPFVGMRPVALLERRRRRLLLAFLLERPG
jgi:hypothetical protein